MGRNEFMVTFTYKDYDAIGLAELVRDKEIHPRELVEAAITQIEVRGNR
jgi:amidase